jgi:hypothetical protein
MSAPPMPAKLKPAKPVTGNKQTRRIILPNEPEEDEPASSISSVLQPPAKRGAIMASKPTMALPERKPSSEPAVQVKSITDKVPPPAGLVPVPRRPILANQSTQRVKVDDSTKVVFPRPEISAEQPPEPGSSALSAGGELKGGTQPIPDLSQEPTLASQALPHEEMAAISEPPYEEAAAEPSRLEAMEAAGEPLPSEQPFAELPSAEDMAVAEWAEPEAETVPIQEPSAQGSALPTLEEVEFAAMAPEWVNPGTAFSLDVWAYSADQLGELEAFVTGQSPMPEGPGYYGLSAWVSLPGFALADASGALTWGQHPARTAIEVMVPPELEAADYPGAVYFLLDGVPFARMDFQIAVRGDAPSEGPVPLPANLVRFASAYACYAPDNLPWVDARLASLRLAVPHMDVLVEVAPLRNDVEALNLQIGSRDVLLLFWSQTAASDAWVDYEWRTAFSLRGVSCIGPVPLDDPSVAPIPPELFSLGFTQAYFAYAKGYYSAQPTNPSS